MKFQNAKFVKTACKQEDLPRFSLPEIAVIGRSNVGKSTLLNHLFRSKKLVKTSSTPGKTQALNFFTLDEKLAFVDLPGYGYAKNRLSVRKKMLEEYLSERPSLLLFLLDSRRTPNEDDLMMFEWICHHKIPTIIVLTKIDKLNRSERASQTKKILSMIKDCPHVHYSATKNEGRSQLIHMISEALCS